MSTAHRYRSTVLCAALAAVSLVFTLLTTNAGARAGTYVAGKAPVRTINTIRAWDGVATERSFGELQTRTYGQTITPRYDASRLEKFTFLMSVEPGVIFRGYVYEWDPVGGHAVGPALWAGARRHTTAQAWERVRLRPGGLALQPGAMYVVFLSVIGIPQADAGPANAFAVVPGGRYRGGSFVFLNSSTRAQWTWPWDGADGDIFLEDGGDLGFKAVLRGASSSRWSSLIR